MRISQDLLNPEIQTEDWIINLLKQAVLIDRILQEHDEDFILSEGTAAAFREAILNYGMLSSELRLAFGGVQLWNFTFKQHALAHIGLDCTELSPRL